jgi:hypothetical protein
VRCLYLGLALTACTSAATSPTPGDARQADASDAAVDLGDAADVPADTGDGAGAPEGGDTAADAPAEIAAACTRGPTPARSWATWPMPAAGTSGPRAPSYDTTSPGVVLDRLTQLTWQRAHHPDLLDWQAAIDHCACLTLAGHDDWRLPSRIELVSLADYSRANPAIDPVAFPGTPDEWFWSSSPRPDSDPPTAFYVAYFDGNTHHAALDVPYRVRCVRGGTATPAARPAYALTADTVTDPHTGLTWQRRTDPTDRTFAEAASHCAALPLAGGGWRLPDMKELQTLIDETRSDPAIDQAAFPETPGEGFWAGHRLVETAGFAWFVSFSGGIAYNSPEDHPYRVRCVR